jgi:hypothetical protein
MPALIQRQKYVWEYTNSKNDATGSFCREIKTQRHCQKSIKSIEQEKRIINLQEVVTQKSNLECVTFKIVELNILLGGLVAETGAYSSVK